jgi:hypothetical protein
MDAAFRARLWRRHASERARGGVSGPDGRGPGDPADSADKSPKPTAAEHDRAKHADVARERIDAGRRLVAAARSRLEAARKSSEVKVEIDALHAFCRRQDGHDGRNSVSAGGGLKTALGSGASTTRIGADPALLDEGPGSAAASGPAAKQRALRASLCALAYGPAWAASAKRGSRHRDAHGRSAACFQGEAFDTLRHDIHPDEVPSRNRHMAASSAAADSLAHVVSSGPVASAGSASAGSGGSDASGSSDLRTDAVSTIRARVSSSKFATRRGTLVAAADPAERAGRPRGALSAAERSGAVAAARRRHERRLQELRGLGLSDAPDRTRPSRGGRGGGARTRSGRSHALPHAAPASTRGSHDAAVHAERARHAHHRAYGWRKTSSHAVLQTAHLTPYAMELLGHPTSHSGRAVSAGGQEIVPPPPGIQRGESFAVHVERVRNRSGAHTVRYDYTVSKRDGSVCRVVREDVDGLPSHVVESRGEAFASTELELERSRAQHGPAIVSFCVEHAGGRVGGGASWRLATEALKSAGAAAPSGLTFGHPIGEDHVAAGDVVVFRRCMFHGRAMTREQRAEVWRAEGGAGRGGAAAGSGWGSESGGESGFESGSATSSGSDRSGSDRSGSDRSGSGTSGDASESDGGGSRSGRGAGGENKRRSGSGGREGGGRASEDDEDSVSATEDEDEEAGRWYVKHVGRPAHVAVVVDVRWPRIRCMEQERAGHVSVHEEEYCLDDLVRGEVVCYRAVARPKPA